MRKSRLREIALLCGAAVLALAGAELAVRQLPDLVLGFTYADGRFAPPREFTIHTEHNRLGMHDVEPGPRREGVRRVLLLGDSFVQGLAVEVHETVSRRLEHHLDERAPGGYDVVSLAGPGFGPADELEKLERWGPKLRPDWVITLFYIGNDVTPALKKIERAGTSDGGPTLPVFHPRANGFDASEAYLLLAEGSALNRLISQRLTVALRKRRTRGIPTDFRVYAAEPTPTMERAWRATTRVLLRTREAAAELDARYAIASVGSSFGVRGERGLDALFDSYPDMENEAWDLDLPERRLARFTREHEIPFLALQPLFREALARGGPALHWKYDRHWNPAGHDLAAVHLARFTVALDAASGPALEQRAGEDDTLLR